MDIRMLRDQSGGVTGRMTNLVFAGAAGGTFPATWSQREFWWTINQHRPGGFYQIWLTFRLPEPWPVDEVFDLLRFLIRRHQALRTKVSEDDCGRLWQVVADMGSLPVRIENLPNGADIDQFTTGVREEFWAAEPDLRRDFPLKLAIVMSAGMARSIVLVCSHVVLDGASMQVLENELNTLVSKRSTRPEMVLPPVSFAPEDQAGEESRPGSLRTSEKSLAYWRSVLMESGPGLCSQAEAGHAPLWMGSLTSRALGVAEAALMRDAKLGSSAIFMSATCCVLGLITGKSRMTFRLPAANRISITSRDFVGALSQHGIITAELAPEATFYELTRLLGRKLVLAYSRTRYDPGDLRQVIKEVETARGAPLDLTYLFNDMHFTGIRPQAHGQPERYENSSGPSAIAWELLHSANSDIKLHVRIRLSPADGATILDLAADESCLTKPEIERALRAIETLITTAARADFPLSEARTRISVFLRS
jgi:Condensation domain